MGLTIKTLPIQNIYRKVGLEDRGRMQQMVDKLTSEALQPYVSLKTGAQEKSIKISTVLGSGQVNINVPYGAYQAYSLKIKKRVGKRGTQPFERMKADKKDTILNEVASYGRSLSNG